MEATVNEASVLWQRFLKLVELFPMFRRPDLERELAKAENRIGWQKKRMESIRQRYDALDRQCVVLGDEVDGLRSRLYVAEQQAESLQSGSKNSLYFRRNRGRSEAALSSGCPTFR